LDLCCRLSPENLTCDGMMSQAQVRRRVRAIETEWEELEGLAGRKVTENEVWAAEFGGTS
jgi:hypothetical protein